LANPQTHQLNSTPPPQRYLEVPSGALALAISSVVGGAGATTLHRCLAEWPTLRDGRRLVRTKVPSPLTPEGLPPPDQPIWRVLTTIATDHGATAVLPVRNGSTDRVLIIARSDGILGPRTPRGARQKLASLGTVVPVMLLPYHHPWRCDSTAPLSTRSRYHRAIRTLLSRLDALDRLVNPPPAHSSRPERHEPRPQQPSDARSQPARRVPARWPRLDG
jgi:hypothetical protein